MAQPIIVKKGEYYWVVVHEHGKQKKLKYLGGMWKILGMDRPTYNDLFEVMPKKARLKDMSKP